MTPATPIRRWTSFGLKALPLAAMALCVIVGIAWYAHHWRNGLEPQVVTERRDWPENLEELVKSSKLSVDDIATIEVVRLGWGDGWFCRMRKSPTTVALVTSRWICADQLSTAKNDVPVRTFRERMPARWRSQTRNLLRDYYVHPEFSMDEDGNGTAFVGLIDDEREFVFIWFYFNF